MLKIKVHVPKNQMIYRGASYGRVSDATTKEMVEKLIITRVNECGKNPPLHPVAAFDGKNWIIDDAACGWCGELMTQQYECEHCGGV